MFVLYLDVCYFFRENTEQIWLQFGMAINYTYPKLTHKLLYPGKNMVHGGKTEIHTGGVAGIR